jgi:hypothetical protein
MVVWPAGSIRPTRLKLCRKMRSPRPRDEVFRAYWYVAAERQRIFEARLNDPLGPWTDNPILAEYRFCNSFRASDRVSQDLIRIAYAPEAQKAEDVFVRVMLHRLFSRPATFALLDQTSGGLIAERFDPELLGGALDDARAHGTTLYTSAFILCANRAFGHRRKHRNHLQLVDEMLSAGVPGRVQAAESLQAVYEELLSWPLLGPFMAYQLAIDLNYTSLIDHDEDGFTVPGPGALRGLCKVFVSLGDLSAAQAIHWLVDYQERVWEELGIEPPRLFGRPLHAIDCQNLLCEVDKYSRVQFPELRSNRTRIKQRFKPDRAPLTLFYPPKWGINEAASDACASEPLAVAV